jgi:hypothetical protein
MERRMAVLFLLALALITFQALWMKPVWPPSYEYGTKPGEQILPVAVPSWSPPPPLSQNLSERLVFLDERSLIWPDSGEREECRVFVRLSSQHWAERPASPARVQHWLGRNEEGGAGKSRQFLHFPVASFLDDDDGDGDPLDNGELREAGPGAEVEVFCGEAARLPEDLP